MTKLLRVPQLAERLGVSPSWIYKRTMAAELPCRYLRGVLVFDPEEIAQWLAEQPRRRKKRSNDRPAPSGEPATP